MQCDERAQSDLLYRVAGCGAKHDLVARHEEASWYLQRAIGQSEDGARKRNYARNPRATRHTALCFRGANHGRERRRQYVDGSEQDGTADHADLLQCSSVELRASCRPKAKLRGGQPEALVDGI